MPWFRMILCALGLSVCLALDGAAQELPSAPSAVLEQRQQPPPPPPAVPPPASAPASTQNASASDHSGNNLAVPSNDEKPAPKDAAASNPSAPSDTPAETIKVPVNEVNLIFTAT